MFSKREIFLISWNNRSSITILESRKCLLDITTVRTSTPLPSITSVETSLFVILDSRTHLFTADLNLNLETHK